MNIDCKYTIDIDTKADGFTTRPIAIVIKQSFDIELIKFAPSFALVLEFFLTHALLISSHARWRHGGLALVTSGQIWRETYLASEAKQKRNLKKQKRN